MKNLGVLLLLCLTIWACNDNVTTTSTETTNEQTVSAADLPSVATPYPPLDTNLIRKLFTHCDYIDYTFYDFGFSVSIPEIENVRRSLHNVGAVAPSRLPCEKPMGHVTFLGKGEILLEGEIYFVPNQCTYFLFQDENKQFVSSGLFTQQGLQFFNSLYERHQNDLQRAAAQQQAQEAQENQ